MLPWGSIVPIMITRLMLSLKKAANSQYSVWGSNYSRPTVESARFAHQKSGGTEWVADIAPSRMESARFSHRVIGEAEYGGDIALKDISQEGRVCLSDGYD